MVAEAQIELKTQKERPRTFTTLNGGLQYHQRKSLAGWFVVGRVVYWTYGKGGFSVSTVPPEAIVGLWNIVA